MLKKIVALTGLTVAMTLSTAANAAIVSISGSIDAATGALAALVPPGTSFSGDLDWSGQLDGGQVLLGGFCFTDDAVGGGTSGLPLTSPTCGALSPVPILADGQGAYDPAGNVGPYDQASSTFDGTSGTIELITFSPTFGINIPITLTFNGDGTGDVLAASLLGNASGPFTVAAVPVPAAAWLFGSALLGLVGIKRRKLAA